MARQPTPNSVLKSRGSTRVRDEIEPEKGEVFPSFDLSPEGQKAWDVIHREMEKLGTLAPVYAYFMTIAADACGDIEIATTKLNEGGYINVTERGVTRSPYATIKTSAQTTAHKYLVALGLTPTSIKNLGGGKKEEKNPFDEFAS